jgi:hypothetical protein
VSAACGFWNFKDENVAHFVANRIDAWAAVFLFCAYVLAAVLIFVIPAT